MEGHRADVSVVGASDQRHDERQAEGEVIPHDSFRIAALGLPAHSAFVTVARAKGAAATFLASRRHALESR